MFCVIYLQPKLATELCCCLVRSTVQLKNTYELADERKILRRLKTVV
jgi:hypothetical protein